MYIQKLGLVTQTATIRRMRNVHINYILYCARKCVFLNCLKPVTFSTELDDTFKWTLSKLLFALMSAPKEPSFSDIILKSTILAVDLNALSKKSLSIL